MSECSIEKIRCIAAKYGMPDVENVMNDWKTHVNDPHVSVGLVGDQFNIPQFLSTFIPASFPLFRKTNRSFCLTLIQGNENIFTSIDSDTPIQMTLEQLRNLLTSKQSLESGKASFPPIVGKLTLTNSMLEGIHLIAVSSTQDFRDFHWPELLLQIDQCAVVMSALKLLSSAERGLIQRNLKNHQLQYLLLGVGQLQERDKAEVLESVSSFDKDGIVCPLVGDEDFSTLLNKWKNLSSDKNALYQHRESTIFSYVVTKLSESLMARRELRLRGGDDAARLIQSLTPMYQELPRLKKATVRFLKTNCLEPLRTEIEADIVDFHVQLCSDMKIGVEEEDDVQQLQKAMSGFVASSWEEFLHERVRQRIEARENQANSMINENILSNLESLFKSTLTEESYQELNQLVAVALTPDIPMDGGSIFHPPIARNEEKSSFAHILPGAFMAFGTGVALLGNPVPGIALALAGYQMKEKIDGERKEQIFADGTALSGQYLEHMGRVLDVELEKVEECADAAIGRCYDAVIQRLQEILESYQADHENTLRKIAELDADIETLQSMATNVEKNSPKVTLSKEG